MILLAAAASAEMGRSVGAGAFTEATQAASVSDALPAGREFASDDESRCRLPPEPGPCKGIFDAYYFDAVARACKRFTWGGCGDVPFSTKDQCEKVCTAK